MDLYITETPETTTTKMHGVWFWAINVDSGKTNMQHKQFFFEKNNEKIIRNHLNIAEKVRTKYDNL